MTSGKIILRKKISKKKVDQPLIVGFRISNKPTSMWKGIFCNFEEALNYHVSLWIGATKQLTQTILSKKIPVAPPI